MGMAVSIASSDAITSSPLRDRQGVASGDGLAIQVDEAASGWVRAAARLVSALPMTSDALPKQRPRNPGPCRFSDDLSRTVDGMCLSLAGDHKCTPHYKSAQAVEKPMP